MQMHIVLVDGRSDGSSMGMRCERERRSRWVQQMPRIISRNEFRRMDVAVLVWCA